MEGKGKTVVVNTGDFFAKTDVYRKHPMLNNKLRIATPGLGIAIVLFGGYLFVDGMRAKLAKEFLADVHIDLGKTKRHVGWCIMALNNGAEINAPKRGEEWQRTALLIVDMQNDFIQPGGPLHVAGGAAVVAGVKKSVSIAREKGAHVIWVVREHDAGGRDVELFRVHLYPGGQTGPTVKGTYGSQLVEGLEPKTGETILVKSRFSGFFATNLDLILRRLGIRTVVVAGVQTPNCIRATAFDALALDYPKVMVLADATAAASAKVHDANLFDMRNVGIATPTVDEWSAEK